MDAALEVTVRPARAEELEVLRAVEVDAGRRFAEIGMAHVAQDPPPERSWFEQHRFGGRLWVAAGAGGEVVGYAAASEVDGEGHLDQVSVREAWAGQGVGHALVAAVSAWARAEGHTAVTLTTFRDVRWNAPWYRRLGFADLDEGELGPELAAIRRREHLAGLDRHPRLAMRHVVSQGEQNLA